MALKTVFIFLVFYVIDIEGGTAKDYGLGYTWTSDLNGWVKIHQDPVEWEVADSICRNEKSQLVSPWGSNITAAMTSLNVIEDAVMTTLYTSGRIAFGGMTTCSSHSISPSATILYITGEPVVSGSSAPGECCVLLFSNGTTGIGGCKQQLPFICFAPLPEPKLICDEARGYQLSEQTGRCYKFHPEVMYWEPARAECQYELADFAIINSEEEAQFLSDLFNKYPNTTAVNCNGERFCNENRALIGVFYSRTIGQFLTLDGVTVDKSGYNEWEHKTTLRHGYLVRYGKMTDWDGGAFTTPFICEKAPTLQYSYPSL